MSSRPHHRGLHHHQHPSAVAGDASGWVESIGALSDEHAATSLLLGSPPAANGNMRAAANSAAAAAATDSPVGEGDLPAAAGVALSPEQEFEACLEHALTCMMAEVSPQQLATSTSHEQLDWLIHLLFSLLLSFKPGTACLVTHNRCQCIIRLHFNACQCMLLCAVCAAATR
jgi:hypothetical protein